MAKIWAAVGVLFLIIVAAVWLIRTPVATDTNLATANEKVVFTWSITELAESPAAPGVPRSAVSVTVGTKTYPIGEFDGACAEIDGTAWPLYEGEKTGVICWWAGGGSEVGIFEEGGRYVVKQGDLDEGSAEIPGFRGNFRTIVTID